MSCELRAQIEKTKFPVARKQQADLQFALMTESLIHDAHREHTGQRAADVAIREMVLAIVRSLVDDPDRVELLHVAEGKEVAFQVRTSPDDAGKVIGRKGRTARAIRVILGASGMKNDRVYTLDLVQQQRLK